MPMLDERVLAGARIAPRATALVDGDRTLSWRELESLTASRAEELTRSGVARGDRVAVAGANSLETTVALLAVLRAGAVLVPIPAEIRAPRLAAILGDARPSAMIAPPPILEMAADLRVHSESRDPHAIALGAGFAEPPRGAPRATDAPAARCARDHGAIDADLAAILYTSGSTGEPKGVMLTHANLENTTGAIANYLALGADDRVAIPVPIVFSYGLAQLLSALRVGATVILERSFVYPFELLRRVERHAASVLVSVPTLAARLVDLLPRLAATHPIELGALRAVTNAAAALPPAHARRLAELLPRTDLHLMYGQTECTRAASLDPALVATHPSSVGRAIPNCDAYLVDAAGRRLPFGSEGELVVRGANVALGYWNRPEETARRFVAGELPGSRVLRTGDRFRTDADGLLHFVAREDDLFKCRGEKVAPAAIEAALCAIDGVVEALVAGVAHEEDGTAIRAAVVVRSDAVIDETRLRAQLRARLEPALIPRFLEIREELPRGDSGKASRRALAALAPSSSLA
ncbi:MAG: hypothetical protein RI967_1017 [Planctomycetota bacterium]